MQLTLLLNMGLTIKIPSQYLLKDFNDINRRKKESLPIFQPCQHDVWCLGAPPCQMESELPPIPSYPVKRKKLQDQIANWIHKEISTEKREGNEEIKNNLQF